jgi:hypothetical protein
VNDVLIMQQVDQPLEVRDKEEIVRSEVNDVRVDTFSN